METHVGTEHEPAHRAPFGRIAMVSLLTLAVFGGAYALLFPQAFAADLRQPGLVVAWTLGFGLPFSLFEYLFHRYLLHSAVVPFLGHMHDEHQTHHGLTNVKAPIQVKEPERMVPVVSHYPVEHEHQDEAVSFPWFAPALFMVFFALTLGFPLKALFPNQPIHLSLILAVVVYYSYYELWHATLHLPYDRFWRPFTEGRLAFLGKRIYSFHLMHHWRPTANLAIVGFWGLAIWDRLFRTVHHPKHLPTQGAQVNYLDAAMPKPLWPISMIDGWQPSLYRWSRRIESRFRPRAQS